VFVGFVNHLNKIKSKPKNKSEKKAAKDTMNSNIGRYGMDYRKYITKVVNAETHNEILHTRIMQDSKTIGEDCYFDTYSPFIDKSICEDFKVDYVEVLKRSRGKEGRNTQYKSVSISTAAAILSYARIHMAKVMLYIINSGGKLYYTDTDSIVTNIELPKNIVHPSEIGKFDLEYTISKGIFANDKVYIIITPDGKVKKAAKGVKSEKFSYNDYLKMYRGEPIDYATKTIAKMDYVLGTVSIKDIDDVKLNTEIYRKRKKKCTVINNKFV
jgi:hypothetical protein